MNMVNRIVVVVVLVLAAILCCVVLAGARWVIPALANQLDVLAKLIESAPWYQIVLPGVILAFVVDFVLLLFIILEVRPPKAQFIRVEKAAGGEVELNASSIVDRLKQEVDALPGVINVRPKITTKRNGVVVHLNADVTEGSDMPIQGERIASKIREVIEDTIGVKMARVPKVSLRTVPHPKVEETKQPAEVKKRSPAEPEESPPALPDVASYPLSSSDEDSFV
jgi:hypothetical protein